MKFAKKKRMFGDPNPENDGPVIVMMMHMAWCLGVWAYYERRAGQSGLTNPHTKPQNL